MVSTTHAHADFPCGIRFSFINNDQFAHDRTRCHQVTLFVLSENFSPEQSENDLV